MQVGARVLLFVLSCCGVVEDMVGLGEKSSENPF